MNQLFFTISFVYEIMPHSLFVDLCADIELIDNKVCFVRNIRRLNLDESPLLPLLKLTIVEDQWVHAENGKESNIGRTIGEAIGKHLKELSKNRKKIEGN